SKPDIDGNLAPPLKRFDFSVSGHLHTKPELGECAGGRQATATTAAARDPDDRSSCDHASTRIENCCPVHCKKLSSHFSIQVLKSLPIAYGCEHATFRSLRTDKIGLLYYAHRLDLLPILAQNYCYACARTRKGDIECRCIYGTPQPLFIVNLGPGRYRAIVINVQPRPTTMDEGDFAPHEKEQF